MSAALIRRLDALLLAMHQRVPLATDEPVELDRRKRMESSLRFWDSVVRSNAKLADRMHAQQQIDKLMGLVLADAAEEENPFAEITARIRARMDKEEAAKAAGGES